MGNVSYRNTNNAMLSYLNSLIGNFYKIVPMYENEEKTLYEYISSLHDNMKGATYDFCKLENNGKYIGIINDLSYCMNNGFKDKKQVKRIAFGSISIVKGIILLEQNEICNL